MTSVTIVGVGSAGRQYLKAGENLGFEICLVETNPIPDKELSRIHHFSERIRDPNSTDDILVLSTRANGRDVLAEEAVKRGYTKILVEKSITNNLASLKRIVALRKNYPNVNFVSHNRWDLLGVGDAIRRTVLKYQLGGMVSAQLLAGNFCMFSGGMHFFAMLAGLMDLTSTRVKNVELDSSSFSNRGGGIRTLNGTFSVVNNEGVELYVNFVPKSTSGPHLTILFESGSIHFSPATGLRIIQAKTLKQYSFGLEVLGQRHFLENPFEIVLSKLADGDEKHLDSQFRNSVIATEFLLTVAHKHLGFDEDEELPFT